MRDQTDRANFLRKEPLPEHYQAFRARSPVKLLLCITFTDWSISNWARTMRFESASQLSWSSEFLNFWTSNLPPRRKSRIPLALNLVSVHSHHKLHSLTSSFDKITTTVKLVVHRLAQGSRRSLMRKINVGQSSSLPSRAQLEKHSSNSFGGKLPCNFITGWLSFQ